ncbi:MAG: protein kinase [Candidatus Hydrogenedentes bacterium]|nr:protein kinase [Candidatus Hydrogenedentota bacterium]
MTSPQSATAPVSHDEKILQGRYRIKQCLGSGGMGDVYLAEDMRLQRYVAVKSLKHEYCKMTEVRKRIERECVLHAQLGAHPNIITLYDRTDEDDTIHLIIEYVDGVTLKDIIEKARLGSIYLTWRESVSIACQMLEALARIHSLGIVHRDVKPANVMITQSETGAYTAKMMDFGIARLMNPVDGATMLTREGGSGPGTPIYMSPEQIAGTQFGPLSPASDVYAMGVVLYQMLTKRPPFQGTITDIFHGHLNAAPPPIDTGLDATYPPQLTEVVQKALAKQPSNRYASATEFRHALKRLSKQHGAVTTLTVAETVASGNKVQQSATAPAQSVQLQPMPAHDPITTSGLFRLRDQGQRSASRSVIAIACVLAAVSAVVLGNFFFFQSFKNEPAPAAAIQQTTGTITTTPASQPQATSATQSPTPQQQNSAIPATQQPTNATQPQSTSTSAAAPTPAPALTPEQPAPVSMDTPPPAVLAEKPEDPAPVPAKKTVAKDPVKESPMDEVQETTPVKTPVTPYVSPQEEPRRTPIPVQTPVPTNITTPPNPNESFSDRARRPAQEMSPTPVPRTPVPQGYQNDSIFQDVRVNKQPAIKIN